ncbi:HAD-IB family phosphatase [Methyloceanibacter sp.]|uniref:HAD-IB family phosphatase n=1 Tax=Methyloceanibacter sp. TaxID=1965321 RepID=UPI003D6C809D
MNPQRTFAAVCFDCDSTLSRIEGIDELASRRGRRQEVSRLTEAAMSGSLAIDAVYAERLSIVSPDQAAMAWLGELYVRELVPGARETVQALHSLGKVVYLVSGGLLPAVRHLSRALAIPDTHVFAVAVDFDGAGAYRGFDSTSPLARADGKAVVCRRLAARHGSIAMVGDGMTDIAARAGGAYVVGFGGVAYREQVAKSADCYIAGLELTATLEALLTDAEREALALA